MNIYDNLDKQYKPEYLTVGQEGIDLIKFFEGVEYESYQDTGGVWTVGVGHTSTAKPNMKVTEEEVDELLKDDLKDSENAIYDLVKVSLYQHQFDALVSFVFNLGYGNFKSSTLLKRINDEKHDYVPYELSRWNQDNGEVLSGLVKRRDAEGLMYQGKAWEDYSI